LQTLRLQDSHTAHWPPGLLTVAVLPGRTGCCRLIQTLKKAWNVAETPYPKKNHHLPAILSQEEVARLIDAAGIPFPLHSVHHERRGTRVAGSARSDTPTGCNEAQERFTG
jgi:hypothetical protein